MFVTVATKTNRITRHGKWSTGPSGHASGSHVFPSAHLVFVGPTASTRFLAPCSNCGGLVQGHFLRVFPGSLMNLPIRPKCEPLHRDDFNRSCTYPDHVGKTNGAVSNELHGMAERDAAWKLNSVAKFMHCVQTLESRLDAPKSLQTFVLKRDARIFLVSLIL